MTKIADSLAPNAVPINQPQPHPSNPRRGDVTAIAESLDTFGQVRPIVMQEGTNYIVAGNHTFKAAQELKWDSIAAVIIAMDDQTAERYLVADNRLADRGSYDDQALAQLLESMMLNGLLVGTGYSPDDVDDMMAAMDALPEVEVGETEARHATGDLADRFKNRSQVALRQFVVMYDQDTAAEFEAIIRKLEKEWGVSGAREVVLEALRRVGGRDLRPEPSATDEAAQEPVEVEVDDGTINHAASPEHNAGAVATAPSPVDERTAEERGEDAYQYKVGHGEPVSDEETARHLAFEAQVLSEAQASETAA